MFGFFPLLCLVPEKFTTRANGPLADTKCARIVRCKLTLNYSHALRHQANGDIEIVGLEQGQEQYGSITVYSGFFFFTFNGM